MSKATAVKPAYPLTSPAYLLRCSIFLGFHVAAGVLAYFAGVPTWDVVLLTVVLYFARMFVVTGGYHRYFSHRTFKTSRAFQFLLALAGMTTLQKGILWWSANHRHHHRYSDQPEDIHSPRLKGFFWSHMGWIMSTEYDKTKLDQIKDFAKYPELRFFDSQIVMIVVFALMCAAFNFLWSFQALAYGCFVGTVLLWHGTFTINSFTHIVGKRVYATDDDSRNSFILAIITMGEGWHNNHHYYQTTARQGFRWYELDVTYYILWCLEKLRIIWDLRRVPEDVVQGHLGGRNWLISEVGDEGPVALQPKTSSEPEPVAA